MLALLAAAATLCIFLLHGAVGPFSVRYGPATAFRASRHRAAVMSSMSRAGKALNSSSKTPRSVRSRLRNRTGLAHLLSALLQPDLAHLTLALRC